LSIQTQEATDEYVLPNNDFGPIHVLPMDKFMTTSVSS